MVQAGSYQRSSFPFLDVTGPLLLPHQEKIWLLGQTGMSLRCWEIVSVSRSNTLNKLVKEWLSRLEFELEQELNLSDC